MCTTMESNNDLSLSSDILCEILSRSSLQTVGRCRLVSKECNSLTYESLFMNLLGQRTNTISGYFMQGARKSKHSSTFVSADVNVDSHPNSKLSLSFLPGSVKIVASTKQGILLCTDDITCRVPKYYVCKPSTQQWEKIPNPRTRYFTEAIGLIVLRSNPLHYKIVRFSRPKSCNSSCFYQYHLLRCEIFYSKTWTWRQLREINLPYDTSLELAPAVSACGSLHWLTYHRNSIFSFHENKESCSLISLPHLVYDNDRYKYDMKLVEYEGKLALMCMGREDRFMELWVMENYGKQLWNKRQTMSIETLRGEVPNTSPIALYNADVALIMEFYKVIFYNIKNGSTNILSLGNYFDDCGIFPFQSDFEPSNLMGKPSNLKGEPRRSKSKRRTSFSEYIGQLGFGQYYSFSPVFVFLVVLLAFTFLCLTFDL